MVIRIIEVGSGREGSSGKVQDVPKINNFLLSSLGPQIVCVFDYNVSVMPVDFNQSTSSMTLFCYEENQA